MEWSPGASFPHFSALRNGVARRRNAFVLSPSPPQRAILRASADSPLAFSIRYPSRRLRRASSERTSLAPFPQNRDTAKTPYRSVAPPLQIETYRFDLRRTFRRNLPAATNRSCAVFRRIRTRTPPHGQGAPPHWIPGGGFTKDEGRNALHELR